jgi:hypothetical protein
VIAERRAKAKLTQAENAQKDARKRPTPARIKLIMSNRKRHIAKALEKQFLKENAKLFRKEMGLI